ncbi:MAG: methionine--tRNA ligase [Minisyncoccia bacterium]
MQKPFYLTTPIFYPNAKLHMGHAYTTTLSDALTRYHRLMGEKTYFLTGSDENTQKMVDAARKEGEDPMRFLDGIVENFASLYSSLNISYDQFIRTTDQKRHWQGAQGLWRKLDEAGDLYKKEYEGLYCVGHEAFMTEKDLVDGKCPDHGTEPQFLREENYFFRLSKYAQTIKEKISSDELRIVPETRKHEILAFIERGLEDVSFSRPRKSDWPEGLGIPVPGDNSQVMYVWCDALSNYITAIGYGRDEKEFAEFWPADVHVIGKDILRFHAAIWPAMLLSAGVPFPRAILAHGFITSGGKKMSKSLGNVIDPEELLAEYGTDAVRYFLLRHISPFEDGDITREAFKEAYNANLANGLGNLAARIMTLAEKYLEKPVDKPTENFPEAYTSAMESFELNRAMEYSWERVAALDRRITETEPFKLVKTDERAGKRLIAELAVELYRIAELLEPCMPSTSEKLTAAILANKKPENLFPRKE